MTKIFTFDDLILYHYNELPADEALALETALSYDANLRAQSNEILQMKALLDTEIKSPSKTSIDLILSYDKKSSGELEAI
ncbi:MAG: hypothetical protein LRY27_03130 [Chitinophagales bacterium]|nr:hypothetical protein [Chitinophagales bacterium]